MNSTSLASSTSFSLKTRFPLNDGHKIPCLGLGVYQSPPGRETFKTVLAALNMGYRLVDTAALYENEEDVGRAVRECSVPREEIFVTTKLWNAEHGYDRTLRAFDRGLALLGLDYVDLFLIHWPVPRKRMDSWKALETLSRSGRCRSIGVSNYTLPHLRELLEMGDMVPVVNQVEFSPFLYQKELLTFCRHHQIQLQAYSPLTKGEKLNHPTLQALAKKHHKTPAQILIRWGLQHRVVPLPKTVRVERLRENADVFDFALDDGDMETLNALHADYRTSWDPTYVR